MLSYLYVTLDEVFAKWKKSITFTGVIWRTSEKNKILSMQNVQDGA